MVHTLFQRRNSGVGVFDDVFGHDTIHVVHDKLILSRDVALDSYVVRYYIIVTTVTKYFKLYGKTETIYYNK